MFAAVVGSVALRLSVGDGAESLSFISSSFAGFPDLNFVCFHHIILSGTAHSSYRALGLQLEMSIGTGTGMQRRKRGKWRMRIYWERYMIWI